MSDPNTDTTCPAVECDCASTRIFPDAVEMIIPGFYYLRSEDGTYVTDENGNRVRVYVGVT